MATIYVKDEASNDFIKVSGTSSGVKYIEQNLTDEQKEQARENIGAISSSDIPNVPVIKVNSVDAGNKYITEIVITDNNNNTHTLYPDGKDGKDGDPGPAGADGCAIYFSPRTTAAEIGALYSFQESDVVLNGKRLKAGDLILTKAGYLHVCTNIVTAECVAYLGGTSIGGGQSVYEFVQRYGYSGSEEDFGILLASIEIGMPFGVWVEDNETRMASHSAEEIESAARSGMCPVFYYIDPETFVAIQYGYWTQHNEEVEFRITTENADGNGVRTTKIFVDNDKRFRVANRTVFGAAVEDDRVELAFGVVEISDTSGGWLVQKDVGVKHGDTLTVTFDGTDYVVEAVQHISGLDWWGAGNLGLFSSEHTDNGMPFGLQGLSQGVVVYAKDLGTYAVTLYSGQVICQKMPAEYLPDGVILAETDPTVPAWAKASTKPSYTKSEVGLGNVENVKQYSASNPPPYPVTSVNGKTGAVKLDADSVGALPSSYVPVEYVTAEENDVTKATHTADEILQLIGSGKHVVFVPAVGIFLNEVGFMPFCGIVQNDAVFGPITIPVDGKMMCCAVKVKSSGDVQYVQEYVEIPEVPTWAKAPSKPSYTADEVGAL